MAGVHMVAPPFHFTDSAAHRADTRQLHSSHPASAAHTHVSAYFTRTLTAFKMANGDLPRLLAGLVATYFTLPA